MEHTCPIRNTTPDHATISRVIRIPDMIDEPAETDFNSLASPLYHLPMYPMTEDEIRTCERYLPRQVSPSCKKDAESDSGDDSDRETSMDLYCVALAAVVYARIARQKIHHVVHAHNTNATCNFRNFFPRLDLSTAAIEFLIPYIHNEFHRGPKVNIVFETP